MNYFSTMLALILGSMILGRPALALETQDSLKPVPSRDSQRLLVEGKSAYHKGQICVWTGAVFLPLSLLALVPVVDEGAFGITAADPGFAVAFGMAGMGLIHIAIPMMGVGVDRLDQGASGMKPGYQPINYEAWDSYSQSWKFIGWGGVTLATAFPFLIFSALDSDNRRPALHYLAGTLAITGLGLGTIGILEQEYSGYRFFRNRSRVNAALGPVSSLSLQPVIRLGGRGANGGGFNLVAGF